MADTRNRWHGLVPLPPGRVTPLRAVPSLRHYLVPLALREAHERELRAPARISRAIWAALALGAVFWAGIAVGAWYALEALR